MNIKTLILKLKSDGEIYVWEKQVRSICNKNPTKFPLKMSDIPDKNQCFLSTTPDKLRPIHIINPLNNGNINQNYYLNPHP